MLNLAARILCLTSALVLAGCGDSTTPVRQQSSADMLMGGGSSFVYPVMNRWAYDYYKKTGVQVNYQSLGSSGGVKQFTVGTLIFGATDAPMNEEQIAAADGNVLHIPVVMGAVAVTYNLPDLTQQLNLSGEVISDIYLGKIKKWNDPAIQALNQSINLPDTNIVSVRRADGSGTTFIFADFLAKKSAEWAEIVGVGNSLQWPAGSIGAKGNEGVAAQVKRSPNSIGYVELVYALESGLPAAGIINQAGNAIKPSVESVTAAAAELTTLPEDLRMSITNSPGEKAYPIAGLSWVVAHKSMEDKAQAKALKAYLQYTLSDPAQSVAAKMNYSRLPQKLLEPASAKVNQISGRQ